MKAAVRLLAALTLAILAASAALPGTQAQESGYRYFDQTGHNIQGEFLRFYQKAADPLLLYGYPITEQFTARDGLLVQYFQRARFEWRPELPEGQRVQLTSLGSMLYAPGEPLPYDEASGCRQFPSGYPVCLAFLEFFERNGGIEQFGQPISAFETRDAIIMQYFEKARLEWQPWKPDGQRVTPADLGRIAFDLSGEDPALLEAAPPLDNTIQPQVLELHAHAFVLKAVTLSSDSQTLFVIVQDQTLKPVPGAEVTVTLRWPDGTLSPYTLTADQRGIASLQFSFLEQPHGRLVTVNVLARRNELTDKTVTSFRIWR